VDKAGPKQNEHVGNADRPDGQTFYQQHIDVIAGKTITLKP
jgi:hypothetical protein